MRVTTRIRRFIVQRRLRKDKIPLKLWHRSCAQMPLLSRYSGREKMQLRLLASQVLWDKRIIPVKDFELTDEMRVMIAAQVALMLFGLAEPETEPNLSWIHNWNQILVYPAPFHNGRDTVFNALGQIQSLAGFESGETHYQGGIIIDWEDDQPHPLRKHANQVLLHEMAHKLDMLDGDTNGHPPLHSNMSHQAWYEAFETAFDTLNRQLQHGKFTAFNPYAATNPAEFFAVSTEYFFESPNVLNRLFPKVYQQLTLFYRQDPLIRVSALQKS
ncbi:M90 family metallopeptidase [Thiomicrorhabdus arctica]|uniref:M90 family metallopeptidase n=1 Tax=Thiomicrorhabdus arctica TaxID=131540 RepID=UPI000475E6BE|nr:M90 family metallopeptidase [Thiomicrorhabdus arctica]